MQLRLKIILPVVGLLLFAAVSYHSFRVNRQIEATSSKYFWWSAIRLDSDPANKRKQGAVPCKDSNENCVGWQLQDTWVDPGLLERFLMLSALPAFIIGSLAVSGLAKLGVSEISTFMLLMPALIFAWYYFIGWLLDRWLRKWSQRRTPTC